MLRIHDVSSAAGSCILENVNLTLADGAYCVILGSSGAGKTVFLETLAGRYPLIHGTIEWNGIELSHLPPEKRHIGLVYQDYALFPHLSVAKNIAFPLRFSHCSQKAKEERTASMLDLLSLSSVADARPGTLSGGEKQRVALGRALVMDPKILLLDEPLSALDWATRQQVRSMIKTIHQDLGKTIIHVTHDFAEAKYFADCMTFMQHRTLSAVLDQKSIQAITEEDIYERLRP
ncbi:MAG: ATP-binding cassette domain-containing protein [Sphaerochaetaceae bacterium]